MPFDGTAQSVLFVVGNTLAAIGWQPVPREFAEDYKKKVLKDFCDRGVTETNLVRSENAFWVDSGLGACKGAKLRKRLTNCFSYGGYATPDTSPAPEALIQVAKAVRKALDKPKFSVEWFYDDPILNVDYIDDDGLHHRDCLGIWDQGNVVAIATRL